MRRHWRIPALVVVFVVAVVSWATSEPPAPTAAPKTLSDSEEIAAVAAAIDSWVEREVMARDTVATEPADSLTVLRRMSLALHGTVPSLAEIREFESADDALDAWVVRRLQDRRFADYFAVRLAKPLVGVDDGPFLFFRRDRFTDWLSECLSDNVPFNEITQSVLTQQGLWTDQPATNFITSAFANEELDVNTLAGRTVRVFLGQRMDCAQCHDHPFDDWKQKDFEGLAAYFGQVNVTILGVEDKADAEYTIEDGDDERTVECRLPFGSHWTTTAETTRRESLASWITDERNERYERAIANRIWGLVFGRPWNEPVDDLPDPSDGDDPLDLLGRDFRNHGYDLRRSIRVLMRTRLFRRKSEHPIEGALDEAWDGYDASNHTDAKLAAEIDELSSKLDAHRDQWAVFPVIRLRPEQVIGSMLQAASVKTIDQNSQLLVRTVRFFREQDFIREYGDLGEDELEVRAGTLSQALIRMNGKLAKELTKAQPFSAVGRISGLTGSAENCLEAAYLICLTRRPTAEEAAHFMPQLEREDDRGPVVEDLYWSLLNSPEFANNH